MKTIKLFLGFLIIMSLPSQALVEQTDEIALWHKLELEFGSDKEHK